ncbi:MAG TPA: universal stress protein [Anaerolineae bacterium]|nr:universal stress protein [Anaerolineae bacterium]
MSGRILVPLDGSPLAEQALSCAVMLARGLPAELILLRAVWVPPDVVAVLHASVVKVDAITEQMAAEADAYLMALAEQLRDAGVQARWLVEVEPPEEAILSSAARENADQIVMATHGYSGVKRWTHGSVAERVLQSVSVPVLLVRAAEQAASGDSTHPMACERILVPLDGSPVAEQILPAATTLARALGSSLTLFQVPIAHVSGWMTGEWYFPVQGVLDTAEADVQAYLHLVAGDLQRQGLDVHTATTIGSVADCIVDYAETNQMDLIAMCTHGRTGLARWALGSVADRVLRAGSIPILLVRAQ